MRRALLLALTLPLAACLGGEGPGLALSAPSLSLHQGRAPTAPDSVTVAQGDVVIAGPQGYCIDKASSRLRGGAPFVLLASCSSVTGSAEAEQPGSPGLLTASVDRRMEAPPSAEALRAFLQSQAGQASLARDGNPDSVEILETNILKSALLVRIRDTSGGTPGLSQTYWRGLLVLNDRLITVTAAAFEARPIASDTLKGKLVAFIARIRGETPAVDRSARQDAAPLQGLINRLRR